MDSDLWKGTLKLKIIDTIMSCLEEHGVDFTKEDEDLNERIRPFVANLATALDHLIDQENQKKDGA